MSESAPVLAPRVLLPSSLAEGDLRGAIDSVFYLFGLDLAARAAPCFERAYGRSWVQELQKRRAERSGTGRERPFSPCDPSAVLAALLDDSEVLREVAGTRSGPQGNLEGCLRTSLKLRNGFYHFEWRDYSVKRVCDALTQLRASAFKLGLQVVGDIDAALDRVARLQAGERVAGPTAADLEEALRQRRESDVAAAVFQEERDRALQEAKDAAELVAMYDDDRRDLSEAALQEQERTAAAAARTQASLDAAEVRFTAAQERLKELTGSVKTLEDRLALAEQAAGSGRAATDRANPLPSPGQPWPFVRGVRVLTLSGAQGDLHDAHRGWLGLDDIARSWLAIRPGGGRVWVDLDGDACTLLDGDLVYLGRLEPTDQASAAWAAGDVVALPSREGRKFTLHLDGQITDRGAETYRRLSSVIPRQRALETGRALLGLFPAGGVMYQRTDGLLTQTLAGGRCLVLGHVAELDWFPDLLHRKG